MPVDPALKTIFDRLPERDQAALLNEHKITNLTKLVDSKTQLQQRQLKDVCSDVQMALEVVCTYLESLDSTSTFTWEGLENFCDFADSSGSYDDLDLAESTKKKRDEASDKTDSEVLNLTSEERKQFEQFIENDPLTMKIRGFSSRSLQFEMDANNNKKLAEDSSEKTAVSFNGNVYYAKKCYYYQQENGENVVVGIRKFTKNEKKAIVALVVPFTETIMGPGLEEEPPIGVPATYEEEDQTGLPSHVQVRDKAGSEPIVPLSSLKPCPEPPILPELLFEPQQVGQPPHNFGYVFENNGKNRGEERDEIRFADLFAGSGGYHQGVSQVPGLKGVAAVEYWDTACQTFHKNNPETEVFHQKVEDFLEAYGPSPADFVKRFGKVPVILCSPPCQSFSGSNRDVDHNSEKDLYRKGLSLKFFDAMQTSDALAGVFENVEGMWRRPNVYFLKKIVLNFIRSGYQVRVRLHRSHVFGDPQSRPRLMIYAVKKFVEMPNVIETHGPGKHPYMTVGNAFKALNRYMKKSPQNTVPNLQGSSLRKVDREEDMLNEDKPAGTIRCGGRAWHPTEDRAITVREAASLQSYPYQYEFLGSLTDQYKQVGNAVPGRMARAIGMALKESLRFVYDEELEEANVAESDGSMDEDAETEAMSVNQDSSHRKEEREEATATDTGDSSMVEDAETKGMPENQDEAKQQPCGEMNLSA